MKTEQRTYRAQQKYSPQHKFPHEPHSGQQNTSEVPAMNSGSVSSSNNESRKVSREDIELVQNLIERCLQLYMNKDEVIKTLLNQARIEPCFTALVWQKLEEENADFFKAYYVRLKLKKQIIVFNQLLEHQYYMMNRQVPPNIPLAPMQNGIYQMPVNNLPMGYPVLQQPPIPATGQPQIDSMHHSMSSCHVANGIPAPGNLHPIRMNYENGMVMDGSAADSVPVITTTDVKSEMGFSSVSVESNGHCPLTQSKISGMKMDASAFDPSYTSDMSWNFMDLPPVEDIGVVENYSDSDILLDSPEQNNIVDDFFVDIIPATSSQLDEEKSELR